MSIFDDIIKAIPANPALRERLAFAKEKVEAVEAENKKLKSKNRKLQKEVDELRKLTEPKPKVIDDCYVFEGDPNSYCTGCWNKDRRKSLVSQVTHSFRMCKVCEAVYRN